MFDRIKSYTPVLPAMPAITVPTLHGYRTLHDRPVTAAIIFDIVALVFVIVGLGAWSTNFSNNKLVPWGVARFVRVSGSTLSSYNVYLGLQGFLYYPTESSGSIQFNKYSSCSDALICTDCEGAGKTALGLYISTVFLLTADIIVNAIRLRAETTTLKHSNLALSGISFVFIMTAIINFSYACTLGDFKALTPAGSELAARDIGVGETVGAVAVILTFISCAIAQGLTYVLVSDPLKAAEVNLQNVSKA